MLKFSLSFLFDHFNACQRKDKGRVSAEVRRVRGDKERQGWGDDGGGEEEVEEGAEKKKKSK